MEALPTQLTALEAQPAEPRFGIGTRIGNSLRAGYDAISDRLDTLKQNTSKLLALGGIAIVSSGIYATEMAANASADPLNPEGNIPELSGASTLTDTTETTTTTTPTTPTELTPEEKQQCMDDALARPTVLQPARMNRAGIRTEQNMRFRLSFGAMHPYCAPDDTRVTHIDQFMRKDGQLVKIGPTHLFTIGAGSQNSDYGLSPSHPKPSYVYDECIDGHWQKDELVLTTSLKTGNSNGHRSVAAEKKYTYPVSIHGHCQAAVRSREYWQTHSY